MAERSSSSTRNGRFRTLAEIIDDLDRQGGDTAVHALRRKDGRQLSRADLGQRIRRTAAGLVAEGLEKGDPVILWAENSPEWMMACLATMRAGGRIVPLDVQLDRGSLERIFADSGARFLLTARSRRERLEELSCDIPPTLFLGRDDQDEDNLWQLAGEGELPELKGKDGATLFYTSGTTGPPKGVPLTHGNLVFQINRILELDLVREDDRLLLPLPLHHVYPFVVGMLLPLAARIPVILPQALTGPQILRALREGEVTAICGVPRLYRALYDAIGERMAAQGKVVQRLFERLVQWSARLRVRFGWRSGRWLFYPLHRRAGPHLRLVASGGSPLDPELGRALEGLGWEVAIGYGLTETSPLLTINLPDSCRFDSVGRAMEGVEIKLDTEQGEEEGEGEVLARGPNVFAGYHELPEKTEESFTDDGWFRTGDLGRLDEDGFLAIKGRVSTLIVTESGENIRPAEVEEAYEKCSEVKEIGVLADEGQLVALVVPEGEAAEGEREKIEDALARAAEDLPSYWQLTDLALTTRSLPRTRLGKIRRHLLEERYHEAKKGEEEEEEGRREPLPLSEMSGEDRALLEDSAARTTWDWLSERYPQGGLTPDSRLQADLGIDSLAWVTVTVEVGERTGIELDEEAIAEIKTVRDLLQRVADEEQEEERSFSGEPLENPEEVISGEQKRWIEAPGSLLRHLRRWALSLNRQVMKGYFQLEVEGLERLPEGPCVLAPNHLSSLDPLALAAGLPPGMLERTWWGGWTGIAFRNPLAKAFSRLGQAVPIDPDRAVISSLAFGAAVLRRERNLVWFPEGQRSPDGELRPFKPGLGLLLDRYATPVVPVMIEGTGELLPVGKLWPRRGPIRIVLGAAQDPGELAKSGDDAQERAKNIASSLHDVIKDLQAEHGL